MAKISGKKVIVNAQAKEVFTFLANLNNLEKLMPEGKIENWNSTEETCSFGIKGLAKIGMKVDSLNEPSNVHIVSHGSNPFDFTLDVHINESGDQTEAQLVFDGNMNPFMKMMAEKPLTNFFNMLADKLVEVHA